MYFLYSVLATAFFVVVSPWLLYQAIRYKKYVGSLGQRLGYLPVSFNVDADESIWIHAVSVGEVLTVRPLVRDLKQRHRRLRVFVSTTTVAGQRVARRQVPDADAVFYFPFDLGVFVRRTLDLVRPRLFIMVETEIWPNLLRECRIRGVKTAIVNGRVSERSYPRYRLIKPFMRRVLADIDRFCVQSEQASRRFVDLGADPARVTVTGSLKFDSLDAATPATMQARARDRVLRYFRIPAGRPVIVAGSTMKGEEGAVLAAFRRVRSVAPTALLIVAPRHPERFDDVVELCRREGYKTLRRTELPIDAEPRADVVVLDTIGELATIYQVGTVVFVGGSLVPTGGHNILEPAVFGKPIVFGPHMENFAEIEQAFLANDAAVRVPDGGLDAALVALMTDPVRRARLGAAARALVDANRGAKDKSLEVLAGILPQPVVFPSNVRPFRPIA